jgi:GTP-binding protein EngB required for normal cell division
MNDRVSIVDIPGIDDGIVATQISSYIEKKCESLLPIILIHLTAGGFKEIKHFSELIPLFKKMRITPTIIFTKFDHLGNDIKSRIKEEEEENGEEMNAADKEARIISRYTEVITNYMVKVLEDLPEAKFFIYNPNSRIYGYRFEYGPQPSDNRVVI